MFEKIYPKIRIFKRTSYSKFNDGIDMMERNDNGAEHASAPNTKPPNHDWCSRVGFNNYFQTSVLHRITQKTSHVLEKCIVFTAF